MTTFSRARVALAAAAFLVAACSDSLTGPASSTVPDVAALLAEMSPSGVLQSTMVGSVFASQSPAMNPAACPFDAATGWFICPTMTVGSLTFTRMFRLLDASGHAQSQPSAQTVALETKTTTKGTQDLQVRDVATGSFTIDHSDDMVLSGIQTRKHTLNGVGHSTLDETLNESIGTFQGHINQVDTTAALVLPDAKAGQRWPQSGTIISWQTMTDNPPGQTSITTTMRSQITFNGTSIVTITLTSPFGTTTCHVDLANPGAVQTCS